MGRIVFQAVDGAKIRRFGGFVLVVALTVAYRTAGGGPGGVYDAVPTATGPPRMGQIVYSVPTTERWLSFAVNIDWGEEFLSGMLALFADRGVEVTFFPTGRWAEQHPDIVRKLVAAGHEIGNHGWRHDHPKQLGEQELRDHIVRNREQLRTIAGVETVLYAPPYGEVDDRIARVAAETGHWTIMWTLDTIDWQRPAPSVIVQRIVPRAQPGAIVLMHPTEPTLAALPEMIDSLLTSGYELIPVGELLHRAQQIP